MPVALKDKKGRLGTFARQISDSGANANATTPKNEPPEVEKQSETPQAASHAPTRRELAEAARLPVPTGPRYVAASNHQQNGHMASQQQLRSPPRITQTSPTPRRVGKNSDDRNGDLFSGSQLGESFMQSGLSTPQNEPQDLDEPTPNARRQGIRASQHYIKNADRAFPGSDATAFKMGDDGMMSVVAPGPKRRALPPLMDGFQDDAVIDEKRHLSNYVADRNYPSSAVALQSTLPMRQVRVKNRPAPSQRTMHTRREVGSPSPSVESAVWQGQRTGEAPLQAIPGRHSDEELDSISGYEEPRMVSDLQDVRDAKRLPVGGGSMHANMAQHRLPKDRKRRRGSADYDDKILTCMTYQDLQDEPFDMDPARTTGQNGHDAFSKLPLKLEQYRQQGVKEQHHMFSTMSMDDWETSGDWFVDQFTDIMNRLRDARRNKRRMIQGFENEAAAREEAVRLRSELIDRKLAKMRQDGQRVVEDKTL